MKLVFGFDLSMVSHSSFAVKLCYNCDGGSAFIFVYEPLALHENLQILDLESNNVEDLGQIEQLGTCPRLHSLTLEANPIARLKHYRRVICSQIPHLKSLDDRRISKAERKKVH